MGAQPEESCTSTGRESRQNEGKREWCGLDHPLWLLLPWAVFAVAAGTKFWRITLAIRRSRLAIPSRTEQFKQSLERIWMRDQRTL